MSYSHALQFVCLSVCTATSVRQRVVNVLKSRYKTVDSAEQSIGIIYDGESDKNDIVQETSVGDLLSKAKCLSSSDVSQLCESLFEEMMIREKIPMPGKDYIGLSLLAMARLAQRQKTNVVYKLAKVIAVNRPNSTEPLLPMNRMPWGLIQYQIDFFACTHINEVCFYEFVPVIVLFAFIYLFTLQHLHDTNGI